MKTIGAKELRLHLDTVLDRVLAGEDIIVQHRFKGPIILRAVHPNGTSSAGQLAGLQAFDNAEKRPSPYTSSTPIKELYAQALAVKHAS